MNEKSTSSFQLEQQQRNAALDRAQDALLSEPGALERLVETLRQRALDEFYLLDAYVRREIVRGHGVRIFAAAERYDDQSNLITSDSTILRYFQEHAPDVLAWLDARCELVRLACLQSAGKTI